MIQILFSFLESQSPEAVTLRARKGDVFKNADLYNKKVTDQLVRNGKGYYRDGVYNWVDHHQIPWIYTNPNEVIHGTKTEYTYHWFKSSFSESNNFTGYSFNFSDIWNSDVARRLIPDKISVAIGGDFMLANGGVGAQPFSLTLLTRGQDPGLYLTPSGHVNVGAGLSVEGNLNFSFGNYTGDPRTINQDMLDGLTMGGIFSVKAIEGFSFGASYSPTGEGNGFLNGNFGIGLGVGFMGAFQSQWTLGHGLLWKY